ncbi:n-acetylglutamate synthase [Labilibacter sediminis]|nr:n-acetylglutamate synthase [Labilibacter sediminis]
MINYHNKVFKTISNTPNGDTNEETVYFYKQKGNHITGEYKGGTIKRGYLDATMDNSGNLQMQYHHVNQNNELLTGVCYSILEMTPENRMRIIENWQWTCKNYAKGQSILEEIDPHSVI